MEIPNVLPVQRILVIEDDRSIQYKLQQLFEPEGYGVEIAARGREGQKLLRHAPPSLVILDLHLADGSPRRLFEETRSVDTGVPIIVLGSFPSVMERVLFLELGADDYVAKPFNERELLARVRAAMRRSQVYDGDTFTFGDIQVDFRRMEVRRQGKPVPFTALEFKVLKFMARNAERVISREELLNEVWGYHHYPTTRTVDNHILRLRQKLERQPSDPAYFLTVHSVGYKFVPCSNGRWSGNRVDHQCAKPPRIRATAYAAVKENYGADYLEGF